MSLMAFIRRRTVHALGVGHASQAVGHSSQGILGKSTFYRVLEEAVWTWGRVGQHVGDFLIRLAGLIF